MADLNITVDSKQVVEAKRDISDLERSFSSAYKSAQTFMTAFARTSRMDAYANSLGKVAKANQDLINNNLGVTKSYKSAEESAKSFTRVLENQERAAREATAALNQRLGVTGPSATESGAGFAALEGQIERLKTKYNSIYAASQLYERSLNELNQAQTLGAINAKQHESALEQLNNEYQQFQNGSANAMNRFSQANQVANKGMRNFGLVVQQSGYQVGDFLVQVQGGTNWMVAFGQQATQLAGLMTTFGGKFVVIGAALSILIPLATAIGAAFMRTGEASEKAAKSIDKQKQASDSLLDSIRQLRLEDQMSRSGLSSVEQESLNQLNILQAQRNVLLIEQEEAYRRANEQIDSFDTAEQERLASEIAANAELIEVEERRLRIYKELMNARQPAVFMEELVALREATAIEEARIRYGDQHYKTKLLVWEASVKQYEQELRSKGLNEAVIKILSDQYRLNLKNQDALKIQAEYAERIKAAIASLKDTAIKVQVNFEATFSNFKGKAAEWAGQTWDTMQAIAEGGSPMFSSPRSRPAPAMLGEPDLPKDGGGGGGGNSALESLIGQLQTEREVLDAWYEESQTLLASASDKELEILGTRNEAKLRLEQEYQEKLKGIRDAGNSTALGDAGIFFEGMAALAAAGGNKTVKVMRIFSAAQALINSYVAFTEVLKDPSFIGRPWARFGAAAKALASGLAAVNAIKGGGGGSVSGGAISSPGTSRVAPAGESAAPQTVYIDSIDPEGLYSGQTLMNLFDAFYNENDRRGKVFVVGRA